MRWVAAGTPCPHHQPVRDSHAKANKDCELVVIPGADHTNGGAYGDHKRFDFFVRHLQGRRPPAWDALRASADNAAGVLDARAEEWAEQENW